MSLADALDAIPVVANATERGLRFPLPTTNQRVHNRATRQVERYDGAAWITDFAPDRTSIINVKDPLYGAVGDGVADDTVAIQAAATAIPIEGATLYFPKGVYKVSDRIAIRGGTRVQGDVLGGSIIKQYANKSALYASVALGTRDLRFADLQILDLYGNTRTTGYAIELNGAGDVVVATLARILTSGFRSGFYGNRMMTSSLRSVRCNSALDDGFVLDGICTSTTLENTYANGNARYGYNVTGGSSYLTFIATAADSNGSDPYHFGNTLAGVTSVVMINPGAEVNAGHGIYMKDAARCVIVSPAISHITGATKDGIRLEGCVRCRVMGGLLWDTTGYAINILTSSTPIVPAKIKIDEVEFTTNTLGTINDPNGAVTRWEGKSFTVGTPAGGEATASLVGRHISNIAFAQSVGVAETDLLSSAIVAKLLNVDGQALRVRAWGFTAGNANNKRVRMKFGADTIVDTGAFALNAKNWCIDVCIVRVDANNQFITGFYGSSDAALLPMLAQYGAATRDLTVANTLKLTGSGTADGDVVQRGMLIEVLT